MDNHASSPLTTTLWENNNLILMMRILGVCEAVLHIALIDSLCVGPPDSFKETASTNP